MAVGTLALVPQAALAHGLVGREDLPIPKWLFAWGATVVLVVSFVGLAVLWPKPRLEQPSERRVVSIPQAAGPDLRRDRRRDLLRRRVRGVRGHADGGDEHRPDVRLRVLLGRHPGPEPALRRRLSGLQPVARGRAGGGRGRVAGPAAAGADAVSGGARALAGGDRHPRVRLVRARLPGSRGPERPRRRRARVRGGPARRDEPVRDRRVEPSRRRVRRVLRPVRSHVAAALGARRRCTAGCRSAA